MMEEEFDYYMSGKFVLPNTWDSGLFMLESMHLMNEHFAVFDDLCNRHENLMSNSTSLYNDMIRFQKEIVSETSNILERTPLEVKPRKQVENLNLEYEDPKIRELPPPLSPIVVEEHCEQRRSKEKLTAGCNFFAETLKLSEDLEFSLNESKSMDDLKLKSVNYDIDLSDLSADNSSAEDDGKLGLSVLRNSNESKCDTSPVTHPSTLDGLVETSLLDTSDSPTTNLWLPSPLKPTQGMFFSNSCDIPSIPCNTGEFHNNKDLSPKT